MINVGPIYFVIGHILYVYIYYKSKTKANIRYYTFILTSNIQLLVTSLGPINVTHYSVKRQCLCLLFTLVVRALIFLLV